MDSRNRNLTKVSIVIPAFRAAKHIEASVMSALAQRHADIEVIVVDDGSDDGTPDLVSAIRDVRIRLITQENRGQSAALNRGAAVATGDYLKFLDADDWINPEHIGSQLTAIDGAPHHLASCQWGYFVDAPERPTLRQQVSNQDYDNPVDWVVDSLSQDEGMMGGWLWLIPRSVWSSSGGWNETLTLNNDFDFSIRLLLGSSGVRFAAGAIYSYREHLGSTLSRQRTRSAMESGFRTTELGCGALVRHENSVRTRRVCADRWQRWEYDFFPEYADLATAAAREVRALGGSSFQIEGGRVLRLLVPLIGWKSVRRLQTAIYRYGWGPVLRWKMKRRLDGLLPSK